MEVAGGLLDAAVNAKSFVADLAGQVVCALGKVGERIPMFGPCVGILRDIFAVYQVSFFWRSN